MRWGTTARAAVALPLLAVTACGTTVPADQQARGLAGSEVMSGLGPGLSPAAGSAGSGPAAGAPQHALPGELSAPLTARDPQAGDVAADISPTSGSGTAPGRAPAAVPGLTATSVLVGVYRDTAEGANAGALGFGSIGEANAASKEEIVVDELNRRGGVLGRKVKIVYRDYEQNSAQPLAERDQEACTTWTEDTRVFAVLSEGFTDVLPACLAKRGVVQISTLGQLRDESRGLARVPSYLQPNGIALDRQAEPYVAGLERQGWLRGSGPTDAPKVGLVTYDRPSFVAGAAAATRALKRRGQDLLVSYVKYPDSASDVSQSATHLQAAVLRFGQERVNRVMFLDIGGAATVYFMTLADNQGYRPRYGLSSQSVPASLRAAGAPAAQLQDAVGTGWLPLTDVGLQAPKPTGVAACEQLMAKHKQDMSTPFAKQVAMEVCDRYGYFAAVVRTAGSLDAPGLVRAAESLRQWPSAATFAVTLAPGRHDGASAVRDFAFDSACDCFRSAGSTRVIAGST